MFKNYGEIIQFLEEFQGDKLFSRAYISKLKSEGQFKRVPLTDKSKEFIFYIKNKFPKFNETKFVLANSMSRGRTPVKLNHKLTQPKISEIDKNSSISLYSYYTISTFLFLMLPYFILFLLAIKDSPSVLFSIIKEFETDISRDGNSSYDNLDYSTNSDFYKSIEGLSSKFNEEIPQRGYYASPELDYSCSPEGLVGEKVELNKTTANNSS
jgi:hypothetical protein